jgi:enamine deaminase RidA (YjgF/YER057c/UK114 family)
MSLTLTNPETVAAPLGHYSHAVETPPGAGLIFVSGQGPVALDGSVGETYEAQADQVYSNIVAVLAAKGLAPSAIIKLTMFVVEDDPGGAVRSARRKHLGDHRPASTAVFVQRLADPRWKLEIDAIALAATD